VRQILWTVLVILACSTLADAESDGIQRIWAISITGGEPPLLNPGRWESGSRAFETAVRSSLGVEPLRLRTSEISSMRLEQDLKDYIADADEDDVILLAYVGHGDKRGFGALEFTDCPPGDDTCNALAYCTILQWLQAPGSEIVLFLNCCGSGGLDENLIALPDLSYLLDRVTIFSATSGTNASIGISFIEDASEILTEEMADGEMSYSDFVEAFEEKAYVMPLYSLDWGHYASNEDFTLHSDGSYSPLGVNLTGASLRVDLVDSRTSGVLPATPNSAHTTTGTVNLLVCLAGEEAELSGELSTVVTLRPGYEGNTTILLYGEGVIGDLGFAEIRINAGGVVGFSSKRGYPFAYASGLTVPLTGSVRWNGVLFPLESGEVMVHSAECGTTDGVDYWTVVSLTATAAVAPSE